MAWGNWRKDGVKEVRCPWPRVQPRLIRFLTSKNLRKDGPGVAALTEAEVEAIESGYASVVE